MMNRAYTLIPTDGTVLPPLYITWHVSTPFVVDKMSRVAYSIQFNMMSHTRFTQLVFFANSDADGGMVCYSPAATGVKIADFGFPDHVSLEPEMMGVQGATLNPSVSRKALSRGDYYISALFFETNKFLFEVRDTKTQESMWNYDETVFDNPSALSVETVGVGDYLGYTLAEGAVDLYYVQTGDGSPIKLVPQSDVNIGTNPDGRPIRWNVGTAESSNLFQNVFMHIGRLWHVKNELTQVDYPVI